MEGADRILSFRVGFQFQMDMSKEEKKRLLFYGGLEGLRKMVIVG